MRPEHVVMLRGDAPFPDPSEASPEGLVAVGGELSVARLLKGYRTGVFPWTAHPVTWWSPDPRGIFELDRFHVSRSLKRVLAKQRFRVTLNQAFGEVMRGCAAPAPGRRQTWITGEFLEAYNRMHQAGHAHSLECWLGEDLAGGIYGVAIGGFFAGESMFHAVSDASKVALYFLVEHLKARNFGLFDVQMLTAITEQLGAVEIPRAVYLRRLTEAVGRECTFS